MNKIKAILRVLLYIVIYFACQIAAGSIFTLINSAKGVGKADLAAMMDDQAFLVNIMGALVFLAIMYSVKRVKDIRRAEDPIDKGNLWLASILMSFSYSLLFAMMTADIYFDNQAMIDQSIAYYNGFAPGLGQALRIISVIIMAPWVEEFLNRRVLIGELREEFCRPVTILVSGALFGLGHINAGGWTLALGGVLMGVIFAFIYVAAGYNFKLAVICHGLANCVDWVYDILPQEFMLPIEIILVTIIVIGGYYIYRNYYSKS